MKAQAATKLIYRVVVPLVLGLAWASAAALQVPGPLVETGWLADHQGEVVILDVRTDASSYLGTAPVSGVKPDIKRLAGHIPGAVNHFYGENVDEAGRFLPPMAIRRKLEAILKDNPPGEAAFYCGSGVNACQNLLALAYAGLPAARLYEGSWSDWCSYPERPVATGAEP